MKAEAFRVWLGLRYPKPAVAASYFSSAKRIEEAYGDLDTLFEDDRLNTIIAELQYTSQDARLHRPDPSKLQIKGPLYNQLSNFRTGARTYRTFRDEGGESDALTDAAIEIAGEAIKEKRDGKQFEVERHLQESLRNEIAQLEIGLSIIDGGAERGVESGFIDILAQDSSGAFVVIELKAGSAKREAVGQIAGYMGDLMVEEADTRVRGILVAADFDKSCRSGVRAIPALALKRYRFTFTFEDL